MVRPTIYFQIKQMEMLKQQVLFNLENYISLNIKHLMI